LPVVSAIRPGYVKAFFLAPPSEALTAPHAAASGVRPPSWCSGAHHLITHHPTCDGTMAEHSRCLELRRRRSDGYSRCSWWWALRRYGLHRSTFRQVEQWASSSLMRMVGGRKLKLLLPRSVPPPTWLSAQGTAQRWGGVAAFWSVPHKSSTHTQMHF